MADNRDHPPVSPMDCREFVEVVTEYVEAAMVETERLRTEAHLDGCAGCRAYLDQMEKTVEILRHLAEGEENAAVYRAALVETIRTWQRS